VPDLPNRLVKFRLSTAGDEDLRAFAGEPLRGRQPEAAAAARDERHFADKSPPHGVRPWLRDTGRRY